MSPRFETWDFVEMERRMLALSKLLAEEAAPAFRKLSIEMRRIAPFLYVEPEPEKRPKHHSHLIEQHIRKVRRPRR